MTEPKNLLDVTVGDGKYRLVQGPSGGIRVFCHGEEWRNLTGNGFVLALGYEVQRLRDYLGEFAKCERDDASSEVLAAAVRLVAKRALDGEEL